ncbi:MAG: ABC transporter permease [Thermoleophilia bacterium]|nr:ABC transporter permease [Thermoleophilia bacterium]
MNAVRLLLAKDLRVLGRSPALLVALLLYPLLIAVLVGLVARFASERPRVAFIDEDRIPESVTVAGQEFDVREVIEEVETEADLVPMSKREAERALASGDVVAAIVVPRGFVSRLRSLVRQPELRLRTTRDALAGRVERQTEALVYNLNRRLQDAYIEANLEYVRLIRIGGSGSFLGNEFTIVGLRGASRLLTQLAGAAEGPEERKNVAELRTFVREANLALAQSGQTLRATANPIVLRRDQSGGRGPLLSAQVQAYALALTIALLSVLVAAAAIASERDENVLGRLQRGLVRLGELVAEKVALVVVVATALGLVLVLLLGGALELAGGSAFAPWTRLPVLTAGIALAAAAFGAFGVLLGALARETRSAALVALLVALPLVLLGLIPEAAVAPAAWVSAAFPFTHAARLFQTALDDVEPWRTAAVEAAWLAGLALVFGLAARLGMRRLLA